MLTIFLPPRGIMQTMTAGTVATDETTVGTASYHLQSEHLGSVHSLVVDKISGQIAWAVASYELYRYQQSYHLLPWRVLKDDVRQAAIQPSSISGGSTKAQAVARAICPISSIALAVTDQLLRGMRSYAYE